VIVTTTHPGVYDSALQRDANDPRWHNHFVKLGTGVSGLCETDLEVVDITLQSPGKIDIKDNKAIFDNVPFSIDGKSSLTGNPLTITPGNQPQNVVSFHLVPKFDGATLKAVCVTDVTPAQDVKILTP
jgi:hypothetical protein